MHSFWPVIILTLIGCAYSRAQYYRNTGYRAWTTPNNYQNNWGYRNTNSNRNPIGAQYNNGYRAQNTPYNNWGNRNTNSNRNTIENCQIAQRGIRGVCVRIYDCPVLLQAFETQPLPPALVNFLRESQCGFDKYTPKVCCSNNINLESIENVPAPTQYRPRPKPSQTNQGYADLLPKDCGIQSNEDRIYNGQITDIDEFPWMALLGYRTAKGQLAYECGGVLISRRYVMTAGHCVVGEVNSKVGRLEVVRLGEYNLGSDPDCVSAGQYLDCNDAKVEVRVEEMIPHPGFSDQNVNRKDDIALLRLSRDVAFTDFIKPICLPKSSANLRTGEPVVVAGWGKTLTSRHSEVKLKLQMPVFDRNSCFSKYAAYRAILTDKQMCAGGEYAKDACFGDSGGPLMKADRMNVWTAVGVVSFGNGCGKQGWPGVYTLVDRYVPWIRQHLKP